MSLSRHSDRLLDQAATSRLTWGLALLAAVGLVTGIRLFTAAFPEASIDFKLSRTDASAKAADQLSRLNFSTAGYQKVIVFDYDETAKTYLEREIGLEKANELMKSEVNVWHWKYRAFRPLQKEEFQVFLDPAGKLVGYVHRIEEGKEGPSLDAEQARRVATDFLQQIVGLPLEQYTLVEEQNLERPKRLDRVLTWERKDFKIKDATYRVEVTVQGSEIGGYSEFLKIPEEWRRQFQELRSHNEVLQYVASVFFVLLMLAMVITVFVKVSQRQMNWRLAATFGGVMFVLQAIQGFNSLPLSLIDFDTTKTMEAFMAASVGVIFIQAFGAALLVFLPVAAGEILYRQYFPTKLSLNHLFSRKASRTREFLQASAVGYLFVFVHFGFLTAFYYYGKHLGFWSPADINYTNTVSTVLPWITPLALSFNAAFFEECTFRLFAIPFLKRYLKSTWLAILIPAFIWGFLHSAYPQQPSYVRGVEVGLIGVAAGWIMVRYGILATLIWHYVVDAFLMGLFLFRSTSIYFQVSGAIVVGGLLVPLAVGVAGWLKRRSFADPTPWTNAAETSLAAAQEAAEAIAPSAEPSPIGAEDVRPAEAPGVTPLGWLGLRVRPYSLRALVVLALAGSAAHYFLNVERFGDFAVFNLDAREAGEKSDAFLAQLGVKPDSFKKVTDALNVVDDLQATYIYRHGDTHLLNEIYSRQVPGVVWKTRYFRPLEREEYWVSFTVQGDFYNYRHFVDEKTAGANLDRDEAVARAVVYLQTAKGIDLTGWKLIKSESKKLDQRTDYEFEWEQERGGIADSRFRMGVGVVGSEVQGFQKYLKVPEEWELKEKERDLARIVMEFSRAILVVALGIALLLLFVNQLTRGKIDWRTGVRWTGLMMLAVPLLYLNSFQSILSRYPTELKYAVFWLTIVLGLVIFLLLSAAGMFMLLTLGRSMAGRLGDESIWWPAEGEARRRWLFSGIAAGYCLALSLSGLQRIAGLLFDKLALRPSHASLVVLDHAGDRFPILASIVRGWLTSPLGVAFIVSLAGLLLFYVSGAAKRWLLVGVALVLASGGNIRVPADFIAPFLGNLLLLAALLLLTRNFIGANLIAFGTWIFVRAVEPDVLLLLRQPHPFFQWNGRVGLLLLLMPLFYALFLRVRMGRSVET